MPLEQNHLREAVLSALGAAEVPADIALGVLQILTEAGCDGLRAAPSKKASLSRYVSIEEVVPCLLSKASVMSEGFAHMCSQDYWGYARLAVKHHASVKTVEGADE